VKNVYYAAFIILLKYKGDGLYSLTHICKYW